MAILIFKFKLPEKSYLNLKKSISLKNIFKTSQGEYIAPEKLENIYIQSNYISQCLVYGNSLKDYAVAVVVVDPETL